MKDNIIEKKSNTLRKKSSTKILDYVSLIINYLRKRRVRGGFREGLDGYHSLKHVILLWPGYWVKQMEK